MKLNNRYTSNRLMSKDFSNPNVVLGGIAMTLAESGESEPLPILPCDARIFESGVKYD